MIDYVEYLHLPAKAAIVLVAGYLLLLVIGAILDVKKKAVPEFMNARKYFARKKQERVILAETKETLEAVKKQLSEINAHYSADNIAMRDGWMKGVDQKLADTDKWRTRVADSLDKNNAITLSILIEHKRSEIIDFASKVIDNEYPATHEQYNRIFKVYAEYEAILKENKMTNGETSVAIRIINESYETRMRKHAFVEDTRWPDHNNS